MGQRPGTNEAGSATEGLGVVDLARRSGSRSPAATNEAALEGVALTPEPGAVLEAAATAFQRYPA